MTGDHFLFKKRSMKRHGKPYTGTDYKVGDRVSVDGKSGVIQVANGNGMYIVDGKTVHHSQIVKSRR